MSDETITVAHRGQAHAAEDRAVRDLRQPFARGLRERLIEAPLLLAALVSIFTTAGIIGVLLFETIEFFQEVPLWRFLTETQWTPLFTERYYGIIVLLSATFTTSLGAMVVALPLGLLAAIYLSEYAGPRARRIIKPVLEILAGIPSVVLGFFALTWISPNIVRTLFTESTGFSLLAAGLGVGILTIPLVASISEDAMRAVPNSLREASYGLGARRVTTSLRVVAPAAISGIVAALILAVSRAIGETMVVAIAAGASGGSLFTADPRDPGQTLTAAMASLATGSDNVTGDSSAFLSLFFLGFVLFLLTLGLNLIGDVFVRRTRQVY